MDQQVYTAPSPPPPKSHFPGKYILVGIGFLVFFVAVCAGMFVLGKSSSHSDVTSSQTGIQNQTSKTVSKNKVFDAYYIKDNKLYGANLSDSDATLIADAKTVTSITPSGTVLLMDLGDNYKAVDASGQTISKEKNFFPFTWSRDEHYALASETEPKLGSAAPTVFLYDAKNHKQIKKLPTLGVAQVVGIQNDGTVILSSSLQNKSSDTSVNVQILKIPLQSNSLEPFVQVGFSSMPPKLSPDTSLLAYSGSDGNVHILNLKTKEIKTLTSISSPNGEQAWNVYWSPKGDRLAFQTFGNFKGDRIGIIDMKTNQIIYVTEEDVKAILPEPGPGAEDLFVSEYVPHGWDKTGDKLVTYLRGTREYQDGRVEKVEGYWAYSISTKSLTPIPVLSDAPYWPTFPF